MKYIQVPVFSKGEYVEVKLKKGARAIHGGYASGLLGKVLNQAGMNVTIETGKGQYHVDASELIESNEAKVEATLPKTLRVRTLDREIRVDGARTTLQVGCQRISKADAQEIVNFITKNLLTSPAKAAAKKASKKAKKK